MLRLKSATVSCCGAQHVGALVGIIEQRHSIVHGAYGAAINLLKMGCPISDLGGVDIKRHSVFRQPERV